MDAVEFLKQFNRMCKAYDDDGCKECPAYRYRCGEGFNGQEEDGVSIVEQWAKEHPVETRQSNLLKLFPEATLHPDGYVDICPALLLSARRKPGGGCRHPQVSCCVCKHDFWLEEVE